MVIGGGKYVEKEIIHFCGGEKYREGKGRNYLKKENKFLGRKRKLRRKKRKILEKENVPFAEENENGERKVGKSIFLWRRKKRREKREKLEMKNIHVCGGEKKEKERGETIGGEDIFIRGGEYIPPLAGSHLNIYISYTYCSS